MATLGKGLSPELSHLAQCGEGTIASQDKNVAVIEEPRHHAIEEIKNNNLLDGFRAVAHTRWHLAI